MKNKLYIVGTPIGNLEDITERARRILQEVDVVLCEDTRVTAKLLAKLDIDVKTETIHQHSSDKDIQQVIDRINEGRSMAFVSDAGTPNVSDPGGKLVARAIEAGIDVEPIPGVSAVTTALSICGFPADTYTFMGFPPHKKGRKTFSGTIEAIEHTVVLFESKHRIEKALQALPQNRQMMVGRELTKMHETIYRGTVPEILEQMGTKKGEFVIVLAPKDWE